MKKQNGITLVALIITIIVMVILAGVIIASAVADGGIIDRAESALKEKEREEAEELVIASYVYKTTASTSTIAVLDLGATADALYENLTTNGFTLMNGETIATSGSDILNGNEINLYIIGKQGDYTGTVTEKEGLVGGLQTVEDSNVDVGNTSDSTGTENKEQNSEVDYSVLNLGDSIYYDSNLDNIKEEWIVYSINDDKTSIEIISANVMYDGSGNGLILGRTDETAKDVTDDLDGDGTIGDEDDIAINSYNNAIKRINEFCNEIIEATDNSGVKSIGAEEDTSNMINTSSISFKGDFSKIKNSDSFGDTEYEKLSNLNIQKTGSAYWIASRNIVDKYFSITYVASTGSLIKGNSGFYLWRILNKKASSQNLGGFGVRPIIKNPINIELKNK